MPYTLFDTSKHSGMFPYVPDNLDKIIYFVDEDTDTLVGYQPFGEYAEISIDRVGKAKWFSQSFLDDFYRTAIILGFNQLIAEVENPKISYLLKRQKWIEYLPGLWYINLSDKV